MNSILVIGASGLVGSKFSQDASKKVEVISVDENTINITDIDSIEKYFAANSDNFKSVINFAAYTDVDGAEKQRNDESGFVWKLNVGAVKNLSEVCKKHNKHLIQISTDFVFAGFEENPGPYGEDDSTSENLDELGWYGWSKNRAEKLLRESGCSYSIVRISYPFYADKFDKKLDFVKNYLKLYDEGNLYPIFEDQIFTPVLVDELVEPLLKIAQEKINGVFHLVSSNSASMSELVEYLLKKARNVENVVEKSSMEEFLKVEGRTPRPRLGGLKTEKTQERLEIKFKTWQEMVDKFVSEFSI